MDDRERQIIEQLQRVAFSPGSFDKRFVRGVATVTKLTDKQKLLLERMYHRYRRQIPEHKKLCLVCSGEITPLQRFRTVDDSEVEKLKNWIEASTPNGDAG